jgi:hypothetical protein
MPRSEAGLVCDDAATKVASGDSVPLRRSILMGMLAVLVAACTPLHEDLARTALQDNRLNDAVQEIQLALAQHPNDLSSSLSLPRSTQIAPPGSTTSTT